jgi:hypothetical protein
MAIFFSGDVIAGAVLGTVVQVLNTVYIMRVFKTNEDHYVAVDTEPGSPPNPGRHGSSAEHTEEL